MYNEGKWGFRLCLVRFQDVCCFYNWRIYQVYCNRKLLLFSWPAHKYWRNIVSINYTIYRWNNFCGTLENCESLAQRIFPCLRYMLANQSFFIIAMLKLYFESYQYVLSLGFSTTPFSTGGPVSLGHLIKSWRWLLWCSVHRWHIMLCTYITCLFFFVHEEHLHT